MAIEAALQRRWSRALSASLTSEWAPRVVCALLVVFIAVRLVTMTVEFHGRSPLQSPAPQRALQGPDSPKFGVDVASIIHAHLFGQDVSAAANNAPESRAAFVLTGVLATPDPGRGFAILGAAAAATKLYAVGMTLPGGARLMQVFAARVIIDRDGTLESVSLPHSNLSALGLNTVAAVAQSPEVEPDQTAIDQDFDIETRLSALEPSRAVDVLRPAPIIVDGTLKGYRLWPINTKIDGMEAGDILTRVNGVELDDPDAASRALASTANSRSVTLTLHRGRKTFDLVVDAEQLNPPAI